MFSDISRMINIE